MKKTLFSRGLYTESLRRLRVFGFISLAIMLIIQLAPTVFQLFDYFYYYAGNDLFSIDGNVYNPYPSAINFSSLLISTPVTATVVTPIMVLIVFSVFNKRSASDFYHALPYTRACIFVSSVAAVFTWVIGICIICFACGFASYLAFPQIFTIIYDGAFDLVFSYFALMLMTAGATALAMSATGTLLTNICVTLLILFLPRIIMTIMTVRIEESAEFLVLNQLGQSFLSPDINVLFGTAFGAFGILFTGDLPNYANNLTADIYSTCLGIAYLGLALFVFILRKSETATCPAPGKAVQHIIRIMLAMVVAIFSVILFVEGEFAACVIVTLLSFVLYCAYELITTHRWKNLVRALPFYGVVVGLSIVCGIVIVTVPHVSSFYTPKAEEIESVRFVNDNELYNDEWFASEAQDLEIKDKVIIEKVSKTLENNMKVYHEKGFVNSQTYDLISDSLHIIDESNFAIEQIVAIKKGPITTYRRLFFNPSDYSDVLNALENNSEYIKACKTLPKPAKGSIDFDVYDRKVDYSYYEKVFDCLQEEIWGLSFEKWYSAANYSQVYDGDFMLYYNTDEYNSKYVDIPIPSRTFPKTFNMILEAENIGWEERFKTVERMVTDEEFLNDTDILSLSMGVTVMTYDDEGNQVYYVAHSGDFGIWKESRYFDAYKDMIAKVKTCDKAPSSNGYIQINYSYEKGIGEAYDYKSYEDYEYVSERVYLPLPDDFDFIGWGFEVMTPYEDNMR